MELETKNIIELHKIDKRLNQIEETKGDLPSIIEEQKETLNELNESIKVCDEKIIELNKEKNTDKISIDEQKASIDKYNAQIFQVKNNKEYDAILKEIDHIEAEHKELLSKTVTVWPFLTRYFVIAEPINPLPPVTKIFCLFFLLIFN